MTRFLLHIFLFSYLISFSGCNETVSSFKMEFNPDIKSPVFDKSYLSHIYQEKDSVRQDWIKYKPGDTIVWEDRSKIIETNFPNIDHEKTYDYLGFLAYKSNDTVFLLLETTIRSLNVEISNNQYTASEFIFSHSSKRFGKGKNASSTITIPIRKSRIILKNKNLNVGDRIFALVYFETEDFLDYGIPNTNFFKGSFTTVIQSKEFMYKLGLLPLIYM
jgi:hypothetical protein